MTKKIAILFLAFLFLFGACAKKPAPTEKVEPTETTKVVETSAELFGDTQVSDTKVAGESAVTQKLPPKKPTSTAKPSIGAPQTEPQTESVALKPQPTNAATVPTTLPIPTAANTQNPTSQNHEKEEITVFLTVDCHTAVEWGLLEKEPTYQSTIPQNGILFSGAVTVREGDSALTAIKKALKSEHLAYKITPSSGYISSVAGLSERQCGATSGWMYRVNGVFPNLSSKYYTLQDGDKLELLYTCQKGDLT